MKKKVIIQPLVSNILSQIPSSNFRFTCLGNNRADLCHFVFFFGFRIICQSDVFFFRIFFFFDSDPLYGPVHGPVRSGKNRTVYNSISILPFENVFNSSFSKQFQFPFSKRFQFSLFKTRFNFLFQLISIFLFQSDFT